MLGQIANAAKGRLTTARNATQRIGRHSVFAVWLTTAMLQLGSSAFAGPWPQAEGHGFQITTFNFLEADSEIGDQNPATGAGTFSRYYLAAYGEYGMRDDITLGGSFRIEKLRLNTDSGSQTVQGVPDVEIFGRKVLWREGNSILSAQATLIVPTGYDSHANPALGDGDVGVEPRLMFGHDLMLGAWPGFVDGQAAYRFRLGQSADQIRIDGTFGVHPTPELMLLLQFYNTISVENANGYGTDYDLYSAVFSVVRDITPQWAVQFGVTSELAGRNYSTGNGLFAAVWWKF